MVLLQLLSTHDRTVGVTNLGVMLLWLQSDADICNRRALNHSKLPILEGLASLIGSHLTSWEPTASPVLTKCWNWELMLATNFGSLCPKVTNFGSQNFGYQIWFCTRLLNQRWTSLLTSESIAWQENPSNKWQQPIQQSHHSINNQIHISKI